MSPNLSWLLSSLLLSLATHITASLSSACNGQVSPLHPNKNTPSHIPACIMKAIKHYGSSNTYYHTQTSQTQPGTLPLGVAAPTATYMQISSRRRAFITIINSISTITVREASKEITAATRIDDAVSKMWPGGGERKLNARPSIYWQPK